MWRRSAAPDVGGHRDDGHTRDEAAGDGEHRRRGRRGKHRDPRAPPTRSATDVAAPTRSLRLSVAPPMRTASARSCPAATAAGFSEASSTLSEPSWEMFGDTRARGSHRTRRSREVYRNPWMIVREDDIRRPDGSLGIYGVIDKPTTRW